MNLLNIHIVIPIRLVYCVLKISLGVTHDRTRLYEISYMFSVAHNYSLYFLSILIAITSNDLQQEKTRQNTTNKLITLLVDKVRTSTMA